MADLEALEPAALVQRVRSLLAEAQALSTRLAALNEIAVTMQTSLDTDSILQALIRQARWVLDFQFCSIALRDGAAYQVRVLMGGPAALSSPPRQPVDAGLIGRVFRSRHALLLHTLDGVDDAPAGMQSALILPLRSSGEIIGTLNFYAAARRHYTQDDLRIASALAVQVAVMLQNVRLFVATTQARDELRTVLESIGDAVLVIDSAGRVRLVNSALRQMLHLPEEDLAGRRVFWLRRAGLVRGQPSISLETLRAVLAGWRGRGAGSADGMLHLTDGRHIEWACAPLVATGAVAGFVLTFRDVSARMELEQLRDDMLHMLVHDLRTPLTGLMLGLDFLALPHEAITDEDRAEMLDRTRRSAGHLLDQVNTILDVRKLEAGRLELEYELVIIAPLIEQALAPLLPLVREQGLVLLSNVGPELPLMRLDARLFRRVVENILGNAIKFTPQGGQVEVGARCLQDNELFVWVQDTGPGVPEELRTTIFEKYGQAPGTARRRGTGLGLAFCKLVIEAHGGQIGFDPVPGGGSIFWVRLPAGL